MKNVTNKIASQVNACARPMAIAPIVSTTTMADIRNKTVSSRPEFAAELRLLRWMADIAVKTDSDAGFVHRCSVASGQSPSLAGFP